MYGKAQTRVSVPEDCANWIVAETSQVIFRHFTVYLSIHEDNIFQYNKKHAYEFQGKSLNENEKCYFKCQACFLLY